MDVAALPITPPIEMMRQRMSWTPIASPLLIVPLPTGPDVTYRTNQPAMTARAGIAARDLDDAGAVRR